MQKGSEKLRTLARVKPCASAHETLCAISQGVWLLPSVKTNVQRLWEKLKIKVRNGWVKRL